MPGPVVYEVRLIEAFSAAANAIAKAAQAAKAAVGGMGTSVNQTEKAVATAGEALRKAGSGMSEFAGKAGQAQKGFAGIATEADRAAAAATRAAAQLKAAARDSAWEAKGFVRTPDGHWTRAPAQGAAPSSDRGGGWSPWGLMGTYWAGKMILHGVDSAVEQAAAVDTMRQKMLFALGGDSKSVDAAYQKAFDLSGTYKNTSVAENLKIIDDLRANLPESMDKILHESTEPFVRLHGFFKAWEGGKHSGMDESILKEISTAIRSGELMGNLSGEDLGHHAQAIAAARIWFGDKFKVGEYFAAQKVAAAAINASNDTFKHVDFPVLVQALGTRAGTGLSTLYNKIVAGIMVRPQSALFWQQNDMLDTSVEGLRYKKDGSVDPRSLAGKNWLKGGNQAGENPVDWVNTVVIPHLGNHVGFDGDAWKKAWQEQDIDALAKLQKTINRNDLTRALATGLYDKTAIMDLEEMILRAPNIVRDRKGVAQALKEIEQFESYGKSKQALGDQMNRFWLALTGKDFVPWIEANLNKVTSAFSAMAEALNKNPAMRDMAQWGLMAAGALAAASAFGVLSRGLRLLWSLSGMAGLASLASGLGRLALSAVGLAGVAASATRLAGALRFLVGGTGIGAALLIGYEIYENWDKIAACAERIYKALTGLTVSGAIKSLGNLFESSPNDSNEKAKQPWGWPSLGGWFGAAATAPSSFRQSEIASMEALKNMTVTVKLDPIQLNTPGEITVHVTGPGIEGRGSLPFAVTAPRGQAMPEAGIGGIGHR